MITREQIEEITQRIVANVKPEKIVLFGSYARGTQRDDSDLDLLVVKDSPLPRYKRGSEIRKHLRRLKVPIDLLVYTKEEIAWWRNVRTAFITTVMETGIVLYEQRDALFQSQFVMPSLNCHPAWNFPSARLSPQREGRFFQNDTLRGVTKQLVTSITNLKHPKPTSIALLHQGSR